MDRRFFLGGLAALAAAPAAARAQAQAVPTRTLAASPEALQRLGARLMRLEEDGLDPRWYGLTPGTTPDPHQTASAAAGALMDLVQSRAGVPAGRVDIRRDSNPAALNQWFQQIIEAAEPAEVIERAALHHPDMAPLKSALAAARARAGNIWPRVPDIQGRILEPGATDPARVPVIRQRLALTDPALAANPGDGAVYDERLQEAVRRFQSQVGIDPTGRIGPATIAAFNRSPHASVTQLRAALDMRRGMAAPGRDRRIEVNIPDFRLLVIEDGRTLMDMAVVVGRPARATPMIATRMTSVQFNPPWGVPMRNAREDLLPRLQRDATSLQARGFRIFQRVEGQIVEVDPTTVNWRAVNPERFPFFIRQDAGDANALGRIKFNMPNSDDIFMHDTPERHLFRRSDRAYSSGCIRLAQPMEFLMLALEGTEGWNRERVDRTLASRQTMAATLRRQPSIRLHYNTVLVENGQVRSRPDLYELDAAYLRAMEARGTRPVVARA
jgi:murein L,D-transpeptidase YcbB/YkuD